MASKPENLNSIRIVTQAAYVPSGLENVIRAVHPQIVFNINGEETIIEGGPVDAKHGYMAAKSQDPLTNHFLKAVINYPGSVEEIATDAHKGEPGYASTTIFRGDPSKLTEMLAIAVDASHYINAQQINYIPLAPFVAAQNCNTVVGTLVKAMGLPSYDSVSPTHSAPGHDRMLLPSGWESQFKGIGHTIQRTGDMPDRQRSVFERKKNGLRIEEVGAATVIYGEECSKIDMGSLCKAKAGFFNPERRPDDAVDPVMSKAIRRAKHEPLATPVAVSRHQPQPK